MTRIPQPLTIFPSVTIHPATRPLPLLNVARTSAEPIVTCSCQEIAVRIAAESLVTYKFVMNTKVFINSKLKDSWTINAGKDQVTLPHAR